MADSKASTLTAPIKSESWEVIKVSLECLFYKHNIDLSKVGQTQRLEYEDFEKIFYHLMLITDPAECRRKFWTLYPARYPEEKSKFIRETAQFINSKQLSSSLVSTSQLRMCGGEPFRRLLTSLICEAAKVEMAAISKKQPKSLQEISCNEQVDIKQVGQRLALKEAKLKEKEEKLSQLRDQVDEVEKKIENELGLIQSREVSNPPYHLNDLNSDRLKEINSILIEQLEKTYERSKKAIEEIDKLPKPPKTASPKSPSGKVDGSKRMSRVFADLQQRLISNPNFSPQTNKTSLNKITQRLLEYDTGVDEMISTLRDLRDRVDENLMRMPGMKEKYDFFSKLIPFIDVPPIVFPKKKTD